MNAITLPDHLCNYPGCANWTMHKYWGCLTHADSIPKHLMKAWWVSRNTFALEQSDVHIKAAEDIQAWLIDPTQVRPNVPAEIPVSVFEKGFAAGVTSEGEVFMLWVAKGQYITITKEEARLVVRAIRAMLTTIGGDSHRSN